MVRLTPGYGMSELPRSDVSEQDTKHTRRVNSETRMSADRSRRREATGDGEGHPEPRRSAENLGRQEYGDQLRAKGPPIPESDQRSDPSPAVDKPRDRPTQPANQIRLLCLSATIRVSSRDKFWICTRTELTGLQTSGPRETMSSVRLRTVSQPTPAISRPQGSNFFTWTATRLPGLNACGWKVTEAPTTY
jgi:hypothetical protein